MAANCVMVGGLNSIENGMLPVLLKYRKVKALEGWFGFYMYSYQTLQQWQACQEGFMEDTIKNLKLDGGGKYIYTTFTFTALSFSALGIKGVSLRYIY